MNLHNPGYFNGVHRYPLLTTEEEIECGRAVQAALALEGSQEPLSKKDKRILQRGQRAKDRLVTGNMRLVLSIAKRYVHRIKHLSYFDLCQEGALGLVKAAEKFDPSRGYKFSTYSYWWIRQSINRAIGDFEKPIRIPQNMHELLNKVNKYCENCRKANVEVPPLEKICDDLGILHRNVAAALRVWSGCSSLDAPAGSRDSEDLSKLIDLVVDERNPDLWDDLHFDMLKGKLQTELSKLHPDELQYVDAHYGLNGDTPKAFQTIAVEKKVSRENVRQRVGRTHKKLRLRMVNQ